MNIEQDDVFRLVAIDFAKILGHQIAPWDLEDLYGKVPDEELIEVWAAMFLGDEIVWDYGNLERNIHEMVALFGEEMRPILIHRLTDTLHGGGEAYGEAHLEKCKARSKLAYQAILDMLDGKPFSIDRDKAPLWEVVNLEGQVLFSSHSKREAVNWELTGNRDGDFESNPNWTSYGLKVI